MYSKIIDVPFCQIPSHIYIFYIANRGGKRRGGRERKREVRRRGGEGGRENGIRGKREKERESGSNIGKRLICMEKN